LEKVNDKEEKVEETSEDINDTEIDNKPSTEESEDISTDKQDEPKEMSEKIEEEEIKPEEQKVMEDQKPKVDDVKKESKKPDKKKDSDFNYIVRIANTDIDGEKKIIFGLSQIKGLGRRMATYVADAAGIDRRIKCGNLSDSQLQKINQVLEYMHEKAPSWILNHRKDFDTGKDLHLIGSDIEMRLRDDVNLLKMIRSYRGIRHETGLRVRGQRTRANNRKGLSLGVSKKTQ
jgi:small subunit ribosomal protein S13